MDGVTDLENTIFGDSTKFPILLANLTVHKVVLDLPKFKFESDLNLEKPMHDVSTQSISHVSCIYNTRGFIWFGSAYVSNLFVKLSFGFHTFVYN